jgi:hypothetical protein
LKSDTRNSKEKKDKGRSAEKDLQRTLSEKTSSIAEGLTKIEAKVNDVIKERAQAQPKFGP